jgi:APA family basic amino acid/polyamine antiporter
VHASADRSHHPTLIRAIGRWSLTALVVNSIIGSAVFGLPSVIAGLAGDISVITVLLAAIPMAIIIACFAEVSSQFTGAGGPYLYAHAAFGRFVAILMGWMTWLVRLTAFAAAANLFNIYLGEFWKGATQPAARAAVLAVLIGVVAAVNYRGVTAGTRMSNIFTVAKLLPLVFLTLAGLVYIAFRSGPAPEHHFAPVSTASWMQALLLLVFAYGGFEGALIPLAEARNPRRDAPIALFTALGLCVVLYTLMQLVVMQVLPDPAHSDRPLAATARVFLGDGGAAFIAVGALISLYGYLSAHMLNGPRLTFALAENGDFPPIFAAVHPRFRTPHVSILIFMVLTWTLAWQGNFKWNLTLSAVSRLLAYGLVCAALLVLRRKQPERIHFRLPAGPLIAVLGIAISLLLMTRMGRSEALILAVTTLIALLTWMWARRRIQGTIPGSAASN